MADAIKDLIQNRIVCDVGCAEGDMLSAMARYARQVIGFDKDPQRYQVAVRRGFRVVSGNWHLDDLPEADVYYFWPDNGARDDRFLVDKILGRLGFRGTIIVGGDCNIASEEEAVTRCAGLGRLLRVPFNEGSGYRMHGTFLLAVIDAGSRQPEGIRPCSERRAVVSMAIGDGFADLAALSMPSQVAYARRLGADHIVLRKPMLGAHSPYYEVFQLHRMFEDYARILFLDLDVLVRDDCPDLFKLVPSEALGVFVESRLVDRQEEIRHIQTLWPALGWTDDYFNNGVLVASQPHRDLFAPDFEFPRGLRFSDQTVINYRAAAGHLRLHDIGFGLNYMPIILPRGPALRFCLSLAGNGIWPIRGLYQAPPEPENAHILHCAGFPYSIKLRLAQLTLALWARKRGQGFTGAHRRLNRVFGGLVPVAADSVVLEQEKGQQVLRQQSGGVWKLDAIEAMLWGLCDGLRTAEQITRTACSMFPDHAPDSQRQLIRRSLHSLLDSGLLAAANQTDPIFSNATPGFRPT